MQWWCAAQATAWSWTWTAYPGVWLFIGLMAAGYHWLDRRYSGGGGEEFSRRARVVFTATGLLLLWIALDWPVGALGAGYLASVHMIQFLLIAVSAPPLLLLGIPRSALEGLVRKPGIGGVVRFVGHPIASLAFFTVVQALTHWPPVADGLMASQLGNLLLDLAWLVSGLVFWWPVAVALPERPWLREPFKVGYLIAATLVNTGVFAYLTFSELPLYSTFELAPPVGFLSTRDDQLLAGLLMKIGGAIVLWTAISILFFRWYRRSTEEERHSLRSGMAGLLLVLGLGGCTAGDGGIRVVTAVVSEPVIGDRTALYLELVNHSPAEDTLLGVDVDGVARTSLHRTTESDGVMRMRFVEGGVPVPAGATLRMEPGGLHVMLEGLGGTMAGGDRVAFELRFARERILRDSATVVPLARLMEVLEGQASSRMR